MCVVNSISIHTWKVEEYVGALMGLSHARVHIMCERNSVFCRENRSRREGGPCRAYVTLLLLPKCVCV